MIPNLLSIFRMTAFLPVIILFSFEYYITSFFLFTAAAWSDFFDGFLARRYNITSNLGSLLDLLADKVLVSSILIFFSFLHRKCLFVNLNHNNNFARNPD